MSRIPSICRTCLAFCPVMVEVEEGRAVAITGDAEAPEYDGYTCPKGRAMADQTNDPKRLLHSRKRQADGSHAPIASDQAIAEIAAKLRAIIDRHGPRSVGVYIGTGTTQHPFAVTMANAMLQAIGSPMFFTPSTLDKPAEKISMAMHGYWMAGAQGFEDADTWMLIGANPIISKSNGLPYNNPGMRLKEAQARGLKLIVVDPRVTECARRAHVHLQALPGEDPTILAGIIRIVIAERWFDAAFVESDAQGLQTLREAVEPFTPDYVAARAGIDKQDLAEAARTFAQARRGMAVCATGPAFSPRGNLSFYLALCLNTLCGRWTREGERAVFPNVLLPPFTPKAQALPPTPYFGPQVMRSKGLRETTAGMPSAALADEMLLEGPGRVRALFCLASNPASAFPDQRKTQRALENLDLLVSLDVVMSATARLAHYVIAPPMPLELPALSYLPETLKYSNATRGFQNCWAQYTPAAVDVPPGSDLVAEHAFFFRLAQALGLSLDWVNYHGMGKFVESPTERLALDMRQVPTLDDLYVLATRSSRVPLDEVKRFPHGRRFPIDVRVAPKDSGWTGRLDLANSEMMAELAQVAAEPYEAIRASADFPFSLVTRRDNNTSNSTGTSLPALMRRRTYNPLKLHPADAESIGVTDGAEVRIRSRYEEARAIVECDATLRRGVVSLTNGFAAKDKSEDTDPRLAGTNVNLLMSVDAEYDPITGMPRMSALPVAITAV